MNIILFEHRALLILFNAILSVGRRDLYLMPVNICPIVPAALIKANVKFELVDIDPITLCMDEAKTRDFLYRNKNVSLGIIYVHTYGVENSGEALFTSVREVRPDAFIIDDKCLCAPSVNADWDSAADLELYSTGYSKFVDFGHGGFGHLKTNTDQYRRLLYRFVPEAHNEVVAKLNAAIHENIPFSGADTDWLGDSAFSGSWESYRLNVLTELPKSIEHKAHLNAVYSEHLPRSIQLPAEFQVWRYNIRVPQKRGLLTRIFSEGLFASSHYAPLSRVFQAGSDDEAKKFHDEVVNLFNDFRFDEKKAAAMCGIIKAHLESVY